MEHNPRLTSSEVAATWSSYMSDTMNICIMKHFLNNVDDPETKEILIHAKQLSEGHIETLTTIFEKENIPVPNGFTESDVNETAPRLFSDAFYLRYLQFMGREGTALNGMTLGTTYRDDIKSLYLSIVQESADLYDRTVNLLKQKGELVRSPYIPYPNTIEYVEDLNFLAGYLTLHKRSLLMMEVTHLSKNIEGNCIGKELVDGFAQVVENDEVREFLQDGYQLATQIIKTLEDILAENHTNSPYSSDSIITDSRLAPFSDKLIMSLIGTLTSISLGNIGQGIAASMRSDLVTEYSQLHKRIEKFALSGAKICIKNRWLEKPPQTLDREMLQDGS